MSTGPNKIKFTIRSYYFDPYGLWADQVARCAGPMRYFGVVDVLFDTQNKWAATEDQNTAIASLRKIGESAGLTPAQLDTCLNDQAMQVAMVAKFQKTTTADHIRATPSFVIDRVNYSNMNYEDLAKILNSELAK
jgi:protein-disulfide isomerase